MLLSFIKIKLNKMALQPRSMTHQTYAQFRGHSVSTSKKGHLILKNIQIIRKEEKPVDAASAFTVGNYHCKRLVIDVIVIHIRIKIN